MQWVMLNVTELGEPSPHGEKVLYSPFARHFAFLPLLFPLALYY